MSLNHIEYSDADYHHGIGSPQQFVDKLISKQISEMENRLKRSFNECITKQRSHDWVRGLCRKDAARYVGLSSSKFDCLIGDGRMPKPIKIDGRVIWDRHDLDEYFEILKEPNYSGSSSWFENEPRKEGWS